MTTTARSLSLAALLALSACATLSQSRKDEPTELPPGDLLIAVGDVEFDRALIWARAPGEAWLQAAVMKPGEGLRWVAEPVKVDASTDFAATFSFDNLPDETRLSVGVVAIPPSDVAPYDLPAAPPEGSLVASGLFRTAPAHSKNRGVTMVVGGDLGGQGFCRVPGSGYRVFKAMASMKPDVFLANGDLIYADGTCPPEAPDGDPNIVGEFPGVADPALSWTDSDAMREIFYAHWRYNRSDTAHRALLASTPMIAQWDDHEVINDFGAAWSFWHTGDVSRAGYPDLVDAGRKAFFDWNPVRRDEAHPNRMYRSFRWGRHLEIFVVDARAHRDPNYLPDGEGRTLLGKDQREWLIEGIKSSKATWKIISSDVPISIPTGSNAWRHGRDGWANGDGDDPPEGETDRSAETGFESELAQILAALDEADVTGLAFVTTDVHFAQSIEYKHDADGDGDLLEFYEFISGPLRAWTGEPGELDPTFSPTSLYAEGGITNFSRIKVEPTSDGLSAILKAEVFDSYGNARPGSLVELPAPPPMEDEILRY